MQLIQHDVIKTSFLTIVREESDGTGAPLSTFEIRLEDVSYAIGLELDEIEDHLRALHEYVDITHDERAFVQSFVDSVNFQSWLRDRWEEQTALSIN